MDVVQLRTLICVAELGSLSKAADRLNIAQPALSRQVRLLENELGVVLFERHGRGMVVTDIGREVVEHAARIIAELEAIRETTSDASSSFRGKVTIGMTPTCGEIMTVPLVRKIQEIHPRLGLRFTSAFSGYLLDWLQRGELDLAVIYDTKPRPSLRIIPLMVETLMYVTGGSQVIESDRAWTFQEVSSQNLILPSPRHGLRAILDECARQVGVTLSASIEADSFSAMIALVSNGMGSTVLPLAAIFPLVQNGTVIARPIVDPTPSRKLILVYPADRAVGSAARFVGESFVSIAADLVQRGIWSGHLLEGSRTISRL